MGTVYKVYGQNLDWSLADKNLPKSENIHSGLVDREVEVSKAKASVVVEGWGLNPVWQTRGTIYGRHTKAICT
jgi:hypothetical protein